MVKRPARAIISLVIILALPACAVFNAGQQPAPTLNPDVLQGAPPTRTPLPPAAAPSPTPSLTPAPAATSAPTMAPTAAPTTAAATVEATAEPTRVVETAGTASLGEVLYVDGGQIWAIGVDTGTKHVITDLPDGTVIRELTVSPDGQFLAFTINNIQLAMIDLSSGRMVIMDDATPGYLRALVWSPESDRLYYEKIRLNENGTPTSSEVWWVGAQTEEYSRQPAHTDLATEGEISPRLTLPGGMVLVTNSDANGNTQSMALYNADTQSMVPIDIAGLEQVEVLDISPDDTRVLLVDHSAAAGGGGTRLQIATFDPNAATIQAAPITPNDGTIYRWAQFVPGDAPFSERIIALRLTAPGEDTQFVQAVLLTPAEGGGYTETLLGPVDDADYLSLAWHGNDGAIGQRRARGDEVSGLWLLPPDGGDGTFLTQGEQPVVVGK